MTILNLFNAIFSQSIAALVSSHIPLIHKFFKIRRQLFQLSCGQTERKQTKTKT